MLHGSAVELTRLWTAIGTAVMRDLQLERINNRIDYLLDDLTVLKGLERSGSDVSAYIQDIALELQRLENRKRYLPELSDLQEPSQALGNAPSSQSQ